MYPYAEQASQRLGGKVPPVAILSQWAGESKSGKNVSANFNYAGIKAGPKDKKVDFVLTEEVINKLRIIYKDYNFINLCGEYDLEQTYSLIYNCKSLLSTESFSGFLSSLFDIPSLMYYRITNLEVMNQFIPQYSILDSLQIKSDVELTEND